ncbi:MAG: helix-turn-helix domain-containing protein [Clostridiaceae bacterium]|nr:helix-turn-helix domain-containing protein [Clostridiaceae bacterium]
MQSEKALFYRDFVRRESNIARAPYPPELEFYSVIKSGDVRQTRELCRVPFSEKEGLGVLSHQALQNLKYHLVITIAMVARYCIEGGMELSEAYGLSDVYILETDSAKNSDDLVAIHRTACIDYASRMRTLRKQKIHTGHIAKCIDYIYDHLHTRITVERLSEHVGLNGSYLSRLFKSEVGMSITDYVRRQKIETAKNMLVYSDYSSAQIALVLAFPSQSYFSEIFRKHIGTTPRKYRASHFRETGIGPSTHHGNF